MISAARAATLAGRLKALADPARVQLLALIAAEPDVTQIGAHEKLARLSQPTVSYHLQVLRYAGLITVTRDGGKGAARLNRHVVDEDGAADLADAIRGLAS
ncbi:helix-turn-helix domain-containing protein [Actinoplanes sp. NPDC051470]|uniref:ArsR/SmtB family transcription factor n=1 Tax=Actinoplanes sp. NPDC051470 TaxID=3157224 RepID=UPI0034156959